MKQLAHEKRAYFDTRRKDALASSPRKSDTMYASSTPRDDLE
jgi:hypothetical protein